MIRLYCFSMPCTCFEVLFLLYFSNCLSKGRTPSSPAFLYPTLAFAHTRSSTHSLSLLFLLCFLSQVESGGEEVREQRQLEEQQRALKTQLIKKRAYLREIAADFDERRTVLGELQGHIQVNACERSQTLRLSDPRHQISRNHWHPNNGEYFEYFHRH
jgi:hypothetical protein